MILNPGAYLVFLFPTGFYVKGTLVGTPNKDPGRYIPMIYLLYSWGSLFGVPSRVPLYV